MITAKEARKNNSKHIKIAIDTQLKDILSDIKMESTNGNSIDWIVYRDINKGNRKILESQGYEVWQYTTGASAFSWRIQW